MKHKSAYKRMEKRLNSVKKIFLIDQDDGHKHWRNFLRTFDIFFSCSEEKYCSYSSLADTNTVKKKKNNLEAKSDCPNAVLWFSIVETQSISWHFRTSLQQSWSTQIIEDAGKQWKAQKILLPRFVQPTNNYDLFDCWIQETIFLLSPFMLKEEQEKLLRQPFKSLTPLVVRLPR